MIAINRYNEGTKIAFFLHAAKLFQELPFFFSPSKKNDYLCSRISNKGRKFTQQNNE